MSASPTAEAARELASGTLRVLAVVTTALAVIAALVAGPAAGFSALIGAGFVAVLFGVSAYLLAWSGSRGAGSALALFLGALVGRLILYAGALSVLAKLDWVHRSSLSLATAMAVALTLAYELRTLSRTPQLFWIDAHVRRTAALDTSRSRE